MESDIMCAVDDKKTDGVKHTLQPMVRIFRSGWTYLVIATVIGNLPGEIGDPDFLGVSQITLRLLSIGFTLFGFGVMFGKRTANDLHLSERGTKR